MRKFLCTLGAPSEKRAVARWVCDADAKRSLVSEHSWMHGVMAKVGTRIVAVKTPACTATGTVGKCRAPDVSLGGVRTHIRFPVAFALEIPTEVANDDFCSAVSDSEARTGQIGANLAGGEVRIQPEPGIGWQLVPRQAQSALFSICSGQHREILRGATSRPANRERQYIDWTARSIDAAETSLVKAHVARGPAVDTAGLLAGTCFGQAGIQCDVALFGGQLGGCDGIWAIERRDRFRKSERRTTCVALLNVGCGSEASSLCVLSAAACIGPSSQQKRCAQSDTKPAVPESGTNEKDAHGGLDTNAA